jgi:hypothetical protein
MSLAIISICKMTKGISQLHGIIMILTGIPYSCRKQITPGKPSICSQDIPKQHTHLSISKMLLQMILHIGK